MRRSLAIFVTLSAAACAPRSPAPVRAAQPPAEPAPPPVSSVNATPAARCASGELAICMELAWARTRTIRPEEQKAGEAELRALCERGLPEACARWGEVAWSADPARAKASYERGCALGSARACSDLGVALDAETPDSPRARELLQKACDGGSPDGCAGLAFSMRPKEWKEPDIGTFWALVGRACVGKVASACRVLGERESQGNGIPRDAVAAAGHFQVACEGRDAIGCTRWGGMLEAGGGVPRDEKAAARSYAIGCDEGDATGCFHLARVYSAGVGVAKDPVQARSLFTRSCRANDYAACARLATDESVEPDRARRLATVTDLCDGKVMVACRAAGEVLRWLDKDERILAVERLDRACTAKVPQACVSGYWAVTATQRKKKARGSVPQALSFLERGCSDDEPELACSMLAEQLVTGEFVAKDVKRGARLAISFCDKAAHGLACRVAGAAHEKGLASSADATKAVLAYTKACDGEDADGCRELARLTRAGKGTEKNPSRADELLRRADELDD